MSPSAISKQRPEIRKAIQEGLDIKRKFVRKGHYSEVEAEVSAFVDNANKLGHVLQRSVIQQKALQVAEAKGITGFKASSGWITNFERRNSVACVTIHGDAAKVSETTISNWTEHE